MAGVAALHVTNGDAVVPELAQAVGVEPAEVLPWRDLLHDGPVPAGLDPAALAAVRAGHLASRFGVEERAVLDDMLARDARLAAHPAGAEVVLWFEDDLYDALQLAQVEDRLVGRPGPVTRVHLSHPPRGDLAQAFAGRARIEPSGAPFAALRSADPRAWLDTPGFARLAEELPDSRTGLSRLEREIVEALGDGPLSPVELFHAVSAHEQPPWLADAPLWAVADALEPMVERRAGGYELTGERHHPRERWVGGVHLKPGQPGWAWDAEAGTVVRAA
jgi:hypothetical protein